MEKRETFLTGYKFILLRKILMIMKLTTFLLLAANMLVSASLYSQSTRLTLKFSQISYEELFREIEKKTEFRFAFSSSKLDPNQKIGINVKNETLDKILDKALPGKIAYEIIDRYVVIINASEKTSPVKILQQQRTVSGTVTDEEGQPLPGVTIVVKGTTQGTITNSDGKYSFADLPDDATLVFSFVGMRTQEMIVGHKTSINVTMEEETIGIEEVVAIGYGTSSTKKLSTSITRIDSRQMEELPLTTIADAFAGQISGVIAENGSGRPGSLPVLRIRGYGSINAGSQPLFVIDGMMAGSAEFAMLNPKSIENVTFLKDAAAGAIYGSRAGNGVILVTTKKGKYGEAKFSFNATYGLQEISNKVDVLDTKDWLSLVKEAYSNDGLELPDYYNRDPSNFANTNWQDEIFRVSPYQNYQLSVSGGSNKIQYYLAANILDNEGIIMTTYSKSYSSNGNFNIDLNPKLSAGLTYNAVYTKERVNNSIESGMGHGGGAYGIAGNIIQQALFFAPIVPVYLNNGDYGQYMQGEFAPYFPKGYANPVANLKETHDLYSRNNIMGRLYIDYEIITGLRLNSSIGGRSYSYFRDWHVSPYLAGTSSPYANFSNPQYSRIRAGQTNGLSTSWTAETYLEFERIFANNHDFDFILGYSLQYNGSRSTSASSSSNDRGSANAANPIPAYDNYYRPNIYGAALVLGGGGFGENTFESGFTRLNYSYKEKLLLMGSLRYDGSSKFAPDNRWGWFPALSVAWRMSQEEFMKKFSWLDELKLRISYGVSGNDQFGNYVWQGNVNYGNLYTYGNPDSGGSGTGKALIPSSIENTKLKWEVNEQVDFGTDISIYDDRIQLTADYFIRKTKDMLLYRSLPLENGITSSLFDNVGNMTNKGIELALSTVNITGRNFSWTTDFNFTKINNKVGDVFTATGEIRYGLGFPGAGTIRVIEGDPIFEIYSWKTTGNFESQEQLDSYPGYNHPRIGDTMIEDYNDDGQINDDDMQRIGNVLPDFTYGFTSTLTYKNFDLRVIINGSHGASQIMVGARQAGLLRSAENTLQIFYDNRYGHGDDLNLAFPTTGYSGPRHSNVDYFVFDASFLRIKNLVLGYNIPENIYSKAGINGLRLTLGIQNLYTFTNYPFYNPESNSNSGAAGSAQFGTDRGTYPLSRIYTVGLNLNF
jgi:TonB-linked SusC/RagA family outer membrane protein